MESTLIPQEQQRGPSIEFLKTPSGVLMLINFILLFISWCIVAGWRGAIDGTLSNTIENETGFYLFTTVFPWILYIVIFIILIFGFQNNMTAINWPLAFVINCVIWAFLLFISSCVIASKTNDSDILESQRLKAATAFGFFSLIGLLLQAFFHHREFKKSSSSPV
ncbi:plasmolipin-like [Hydractinia symbiolongicarpus]|uniref:plasmolipin-like n=1 Tax=Hydractinia symbiolongicarpus TaxID=13093 RepID=UPI00254E9AE7|nr:plasmolipin-like [Hydractinia symbiolongicarpus]